jgi:hypothetical protein
MLLKTLSLSRRFARVSSGASPVPATSIKRGQYYATKRIWEDKVGSYYDLLEFKVEDHQVKTQVVNGNELHFFRGDQIGLQHSQELVQHYIQQRPALAIDCVNHLLDIEIYAEQIESKE